MSEFTGHLILAFLNYKYSLILVTKSTLFQKSFIAISIYSTSDADLCDKHFLLQTSKPTRISSEYSPHQQTKIKYDPSILGVLRNFFLCFSTFDIVPKIILAEWKLEQIRRREPQALKEICGVESVQNGTSEAYSRFTQRRSITKTRLPKYDIKPLIR